MERQCQNLLNLVRSALTDCSAEVQDLDASALLSLAQAQGVANLLYPAFRKLPEELRPDAKVLRLCKELTYTAASRDAIQEKELSSVLTAFHEARIPVLPLKGCVIKKLYPRAEYRYMTDVDLLFPGDQGRFRGYGIYRSAVRLGRHGFLSQPFRYELRAAPLSERGRVFSVFQSFFDPAA